MVIDFLLDVFQSHRDDDAIVWRDHRYPYAWLLDTIDRSRHLLTSNGVGAGSVVSLEADACPQAVAVMLALVERRCVIVPLTETVGPQTDRCRHVAQVETVIGVRNNHPPVFTDTRRRAEHALYTQLRTRDHPGLVLFSSGSTGASKAVVHDWVALLKKFTVRRHALRTIAFFLFDHIAGVDTLFYTLSNGGCTIFVDDRSPETVCRSIERHRVQVLPVSPTFMNLILISQAYEKYDLSSLEVVSYGTEVMPQSTLQRFCQVFPAVRTLQKYGMSEIGALRSKSRASDSCWVKVGGEGFDVRVIDGILQIKAESAMLGYLNAPTPFTEDGWLITGDAVEVDGQYIKFLGRKSETINIGGEKFQPAEVENVLLQMDGVDDAVVGSEPHPITGRLVKATVVLSTDEARNAFRTRMARFCSDRLPPFKIPQKVEISRQPLYGNRYKKKRTASNYANDTTTD